MLKTARDLFTDDIEKIVIDSAEEYHRLRRFVEVFMPERVDAIELYEGQEPIFDAYGIEDEIQRAQSRKVPLPSGGHLILDQAAFFLDDHDFVQALGEIPYAMGLERPGHRHLVKAQSQAGGAGLIDPKIAQGLPRVLIGLAHRNDAQPGGGGVQNDLVQAVGPGKGQGGRDLVAMEAFLLGQRGVWPAQRKAARRQVEPFRRRDRDLRVGQHRHIAVHDLGDHLQARPQAGEARHLPADQAVFDLLGHR